MSIVEHIHTVRDWMETQVCSRIQLKLPGPAGEEAGGYPYRLATPAAFALYTPGSDRLPPGVHADAPSVCVELLQGAESPLRGTGTLRLRLSFCAWNPGLYGPDLLAPTPQVEARVGEVDGAQVPLRDFGTSETLQARNMDGWMDAWNFVDLALRELENSEYIGGLRLVKERPVRFGPFSEVEREREVLTDRYPLWYAWIRFSLGYGLTRTQRPYRDLL